MGNVFEKDDIRLDNAHHRVLCPLRLSLSCPSNFDEGENENGNLFVFSSRISHHQLVENVCYVFERAKESASANGEEVSVDAQAGKQIERTSALDLWERSV